MKIAAVRGTWVHVPIPETGQHVSNFGRVASFDSVIVRVDTDAGITGWGEAKAGVGSAASCAGLAAMVNLDLAPMLVGQDPRDISRLWDTMYTASARATPSPAATACRSSVGAGSPSAPSPGSTSRCGTSSASR
jgi:L-alanine-DL-glutamate epimerase-like enolase superfamily enzyme